jgi:hypothetical protein
MKLLDAACHKHTAYATCKRTDLDGSWTPGESKLRTFNAMLDQEGPAQTSWCSTCLREVVGQSSASAHTVLAE